MRMLTRRTGHTTRQDKVWYKCIGENVKVAPNIEKTIETHLS